MYKNCPTCGIKLNLDLIDECPICLEKKKVEERKSGVFKCEYCSSTDGYRRVRTLCRKCYDYWREKESKRIIYKRIQKWVSYRRKISPPQNLTVDN